MLAILKNKIENTDAVNKMMNLGMPKKTAQIFAQRLTAACKAGGLAADQRKTLNALACQIIIKGHADELDIKAMTGLCPPIARAMMDHFGYSHRALIRHAAAGKLTAVRFIEVIMKRF